MLARPFFVTPALLCWASPAIPFGRLRQTALCRTIRAAIILVSSCFSFQLRPASTGTIRDAQRLNPLYELVKDRTAR